MATRRTKATTWPLGEYVRNQRGKMAIREAARRANISESRWRQIELGAQRIGTDINGDPITVAIHVRAETVAAMCRAIDADPRRGLELAGHNPDQYAWMLEEPTEHLAGADRTEWFASLPREDREAVLAELQQVHVDVEVKRARRTTG